MKRISLIALALVLALATPVFAQTGTRALLSAIDTLAQHGWTLNCAYRVRTDNIYDLKDEYGRPDTDTYVKSAKGTYAEYNDMDIVVGYNNGGTIFELRDCDARMNRISLEDVEDFYGKADHVNTTSKEKFVSYILNEDINIKFVFNRDGSVLRQYNVIWLEGTANSRADDPGRDW